LTSYIRNPIQFISKILRIREVEEVENIALNTLGTIIHETLRCCTNLLLGNSSEAAIENCFKQIDDEVLKQFKAVYKEKLKGRNLLAFEVAKRNVSNFLKVELESKSGDAIKDYRLRANI
jgi:hypothetical protein